MTFSVTVSLLLPSSMLKLPSYSSFWPRTQTLLPLRHAWEAIVLRCHSIITLCMGSVDTKFMESCF